MAAFRLVIPRAALVFAAASLSCSRPSGALPKAEYDPATGRLRSFAYDVNKNGRNNAVVFMDGARLDHIELDLDGNGKVDRWDFYGPDGRLARVGLSQRNDGVMDAEAFYTAAGALDHMRISTQRNGRYDRTEFYENNLLVRSEEDTNGDGKPDKWDTYRPEPHPSPGAPPYTIISTAFDETGAGHPTRRFIYGERGAVSRVEVDRGDGVFVAIAPPARGTAPESAKRPR